MADLLWFRGMAMENIHCLMPPDKFLAVVHEHFRGPVRKNPDPTPRTAIWPAERDINEPAIADPVLHAIGSEDLVALPQNVLLLRSRHRNIHRISSFWVDSGLLTLIKLTRDRHAISEILLALTSASRSSNAKIVLFQSPLFGIWKAKRYIFFAFIAVSSSRYAVISHIK